MKVDPKTIGAIIAGVKSVCSDKKTQKMVLGEYSDGKRRNLIDALNGEVLSPEQKSKKLYKKRKSGKKKIKL